MTTTEIVPAKRRFNEVRNFLTSGTDKFAEVLPRYISADRLVRVALHAISEQPELLECTNESIAIALMDCARLGLEPGHTAHLVKYGTHCQMIPDWRGLIDLARRSGRVSDVYAQVVRKGDEFDFEYGSTPFIRHKPRIFDRGEPVAFYAIAYPADTAMHPMFEVMAVEDVQKIQSRAKAKAGPWKTDFEEMGRKTVVKRLGKYLPQSPEMMAAIEMDNRWERGEPATLGEVDPTYSFAPSEPVSRPTNGSPSRQGSLAEKLAQEQSSPASEAPEPEAPGELFEPTLKPHKDLPPGWYLEAKGGGKYDLWAACNPDGEGVIRHEGLDDYVQRVAGPMSLKDAKGAVAAIVEGDEAKAE